MADPSTVHALTRRSILVAGAAAGGGLLVGVVMEGQPALAARLQPLRPVAVGAWLRITPEAVTILLPVTEMGQGVATALPMLVAEELDCDWRSVRWEAAPIAPAYVNPMFGQMATGGSTSVRAFFLPLRRAGAAARLMLIRAAAAAWGVRPGDCVTENGVVRHDETGRIASFAALAPAAARLPVPPDPPLRARETWRLLGTAIPRLDGPAKLDGSARFGIDVRPAGLLYAAIRHCPYLGGEMAGVDETGLLASGPIGPVTVVPLRAAVAVIAESWWTARQALDRLDIAWSRPATAVPDTAVIRDRLAAAVDGPTATALARGNLETAIAGAAHLLHAEFYLPFLAHAAPEPINCTVRIDADGCEVWAPTQAPGAFFDAIPKMLGIPPTALTVHPTLAGGSFGRRFEIDAALEAVQIAKAAAGRPVQTIWDRVDDFRRDFFRPTCLHRATLGIDQTGRITLCHHRVAAPSVLARVYPAGIKDGIDPTAVEGLIDQPYAIPVHHVGYARVDTGVPVGFWRGGGHGANAFVLESLIDEAAAATGTDPYRYRRSLLEAAPRYLRVLDEAAARAGWNEPLPAVPGLRRGRGIAIHGCFGTIVAEVAEVSVSADDRVRVDRVVAVVDCGLAVNPDLVAAQIEGAIVFALGAVLGQAITIEDGAVRETDFLAFPLPVLADTPRIDVHLLGSAAALGGISETGVPPLAPAVTNAVYAATGVRRRTLPIAGTT